VTNATRLVVWITAVVAADEARPLVARVRVRSSNAPHVDGYVALAGDAADYANTTAGGTVHSDPATLGGAVGARRGRGSATETSNSSASPGWLLWLIVAIAIVLACALIVIGVWRYRKLQEERQIALQKRAAAEGDGSDDDMLGDGGGSGGNDSLETAPQPVGPGGVVARDGSVSLKYITSPLAKSQGAGDAPVGFHIDGESESALDEVSIPDVDL